MVSVARCGSPALKGQPYCHHHYSLRRLLPKRFVTWDSFVNDNSQGMRFIPMPLLEDALSIQTAYMQIVNGVLSSQMQLPAARVALAAVKAAARNLPWVKTERAAMEGGQAELSQDVSETREKVWAFGDNTTLDDTCADPPDAASAQSTEASAAAPAQSAESGEEPKSATSPLLFRKQPESDAQARPGRTSEERSGQG
jgi:hypothetical protein